MIPNPIGENPHLDDEEFEFLCRVRPTPNPTPRAIATTRKMTSPIIIQKPKPRRFCDLSSSSLCDPTSGRESIFAKGVRGGGGEPASFSVSLSLSWSYSGPGEPYSGAESPILSLKSGLEGV